MPEFAYSAINAQGVELSGELQASDFESARQQLRGRGLFPEQVLELEHGAGERGAPFKRVKSRSLQVFSRQFATMIEAGLSVVGALVILEEQTDDKHLARTITDVRERVESGLLLSEALARHPKVFNDLYVAMVEAGEAAGTLDVVLDRLARQIEKETQIKRRVKGAMIYPSVVISFACLVLTALLLFLVPIFQDLFKELHGELPMLTQWVIGASNLLRHQWFVVLPAIGLLIWGFRYAKRTEPGRDVWDRFKLAVPMKIGDVVLKVTMARFSRALGTLVGAGVDIITALEITGQTAGNRVIEQALAGARVRVQEGATIAQPLIENSVFPPLVSHMVRIGEETGELEKMLGKIADFYEDEVDASIQALTSIVEPLLMILVGAVVGVIIIAMYLPMFKLLTLIQ